MSQAIEHSLVTALDPAPDAIGAVHGLLGSWERHVTTATWLFVGLGLAVRLIRYLLRFPLWGDEAMVAENFLDRGYADLLRPLDYGQSCPLLFLWAELTVVKLWGFQEMALRLVPTLCSLASVILFRDFAARILRGLPLLLAVGVFAVSYYPIRHGAEVKPYAGDLLAALVLLCLAVRWLAQPDRPSSRHAPRAATETAHGVCLLHERPGWLWALAAVAPICLGMSFPAAFVAGGVSLTLLARVWRQSERATWLAYAAYNAAVAAAFVVLYFAFLRPTLAAVEADATSYHWVNGFPPLAEPLKLLVWLVSTHTSHMLAYPLGAEQGGSSLTTLLCLVGVVVLCRRRRLEVLALALLPLGLGLVAAALHKYPYGQSARIMQYAAPAICLLCGLGLATAATWWRGRAAARRLAAVTVLSLGAIGLGGLGRDLLRPYKTPFDRDTRDFARWFWTAQTYDEAELLCATADLGLEFRYDPIDPLSPEYLCNQRIFRRRETVASRLDQAQRSRRPLRLIVHHGTHELVDDSAVERWGRSFASQRELELGRVSALRVNAGRGGIYDFEYRVYEFREQGAGGRDQESGVRGDSRPESGPRLLTPDPCLVIPAYLLIPAS